MHIGGLTNMPVTLEIEGLDALLKKLRVDWLVKPSTDKVAEGAADAGVKVISGRVPRRTGATAQSLGARSTSGGAIVSIRGAAMFQEFGTSRGVRPRRFFVAGVREMRRQMRAGFDKAKVDIEKRWGS